MHTCVLVRARFAFSLYLVSGHAARCPGDSLSIQCHKSEGTGACELQRNLGAAAQPESGCTQWLLHLLYKLDLLDCAQEGLEWELGS